MKGFMEHIVIYGSTHNPHYNWLAASSFITTRQHKRHTSWPPRHIVPLRRQITQFVELITTWVNSQSAFKQSKKCKHMPGATAPDQPTTKRVTAIPFANPFKKALDREARLTVRPAWIIRSWVLSSVWARWAAAWVAMHDCTGPNIQLTLSSYSRPIRCQGWLFISPSPWWWCKRCG